MCVHHTWNTSDCSFFSPPLLLHSCPHTGSTNVSQADFDSSPSCLGLLSGRTAGPCHHTWLDSEFLRFILYCFVYVCLCGSIPCVYRYLRLPEWSIRSLGAAVTGSWELPDLSAGNRIHILWGKKIAGVLQLLFFLNSFGIENNPKCKQTKQG